MALLTRKKLKKSKERCQRTPQADTTKVVMAQLQINAAAQEHRGNMVITKIHTLVSPYMTLVLFQFA